MYTKLYSSIKITISTLLLLMSMSVFGQTEEPEFSCSFYPTKGESYYIYSDVANVRSGGGKDTEKIDQLVCGDEVTILEQGSENNEETINNLKASWIKIQYQKNGETKEGYLWKLNLSKTQLRRGDVKFVFGIDNVRNKGDNYVYVAQTKALRDGVIVSRVQFETETIPLIGASVIDETRLIDIEKVIKISFSGEACGIPSIDQYFVWNGKDLKYLTNTYSVGDAGVYGHSESLIFPNGYDGYSNVVIKFISQYEAYEDANGDYMDDGKYQYKSEIYVWDGNKLTLQDQNWKEFE